MKFLKNNKGQAGANLGTFFGQIFMNAFIVFGIFQFIGFLIPSIGQFILNASSVYFPGASILIMFIGAGLIGMAFNAMALRFLTGFPVWDKRTTAFLIGGISFLAVAFILPIFASEAVTQSLILP